ncbi:molybdate ABC transporter substrate-binding protein [Pseudoflavonifractor capillosus]|uniref:molybdate ABC transporter substrate-binding protein n=1 Tax=Pseudoflavonifractor capillosus TaxID=106588 RepID=UPI00195F0509|nr:molybdate ABC transporter substrate-binding protein [Pseudoflavonifractor capillosus]MBM6693871.1 molybdate ABC transporter substrate-binding protein [Pseudoflavonifractor capillosus]
MKRKPLVCACLISALLLPMWGCSSTPTTSEQTEVVVFAAASLESALTQIAQTYEAQHEDVKLTFTFDSSGTLKTQIEEGAVCDLFLSAAQKQMNQLDSQDTTGTNTDGLDFVYSGTRIDLLENQVVLAVPLENPGKINSFSDLASGDDLLCIGNDDVPVGAYSLEILDYLGYSLDQLEDQGKVTYASNVSEVARQVQEGVVDAGMVYATDASTYGLNVVDAATPEMCQQVIYPAAVMKSGGADSYDAAEDFLTYLYTNEEAISVWKDVGFTLIAQGEN